VPRVAAIAIQRIAVAATRSVAVLAHSSDIRAGRYSNFIASNLFRVARISVSVGS
jgi:hypothetical protein